jgi:uncharacterized protein YdaL
LRGDPFSDRNDEICPALERAEGSLSAHHEHLTVDADKNRVARSMEDMERGGMVRWFFGHTSTLLL